MNEIGIAVTFRGRIVTNKRKGKPEIHQYLIVTGMRYNVSLE